MNYRPDYVSEWLIPYLDEQVSVSALNAEQLENLACSWLGPHPSLKGVAQRIRERASGNPFFVEEAVLALEEAGYIKGSRGQYELAQSIEHWPVPDTVHALLAARMDRLDEGHKNLLQNAAVIGQEFSTGWLRRLAEVEVDEGLAVLEDAGFVHQKRSGEDLEYAFCHPLMQEVAYSTQLETRRREMHARLATALEKQNPIGPLPNEASIRIAWHWQAAGEWTKAGIWNLQAARWGAGRDLRVSTEQTTLALANLDRAPLTDEVRKLRIAARASLIRMTQFVAIDSDQIERVYAEAQQMARECGDVASSAELMISYSNELLHRGDAAGAAKVTDDAVKAALAAGLRPLLTRFRLAILLSHNAAGMPREGIQLVDEGGIEWRTRPVDDDNYMSRGFYGSMLGWLGRLGESQQNLDAAIAWASQVGRPISWMHAFRVDLCGFTGDYTLALPEARQAVKGAEEFGSPFFKAISARALCRALCLHGRFEEALPVMEESRALTAAGGFAHQLEASYLATFAEAYLGAGRIPQAWQAATSAIASAQRSGSRVWEVAAWLAFLGLPTKGEWTERVAEGLARTQELIDTSGAIGFMPGLSLARAHWAKSAAERERHVAAALAEFERQGAPEQVRRLRQVQEKAA